MINHIRTLLLNEAAARRPPLTFPGEEFVPPNFAPRRLSAALSRPLQVLFGRSPDALFQNYRLRQVMALLHTSVVADVLTRDDPRITYWPTAPGAFDTVFGVQVEQYLGGPRDLHVLGEVQADDRAGVCQFRWRVIASGTSVQVFPDVGSVRTPYQGTVSFQNQLSTPIPLPGSTLQARLTFATEPCGWTVTAVGPPAKGFAEVIQELLTAFQGETLAALFREPRTAPYDALYDVWMQEPTTLGKVAAALLALAYRIEEQPTQEGGPYA